VGEGAGLADADDDDEDDVRAGLAGADEDDDVRAGLADAGAAADNLRWRCPDPPQPLLSAATKTTPIRMLRLTGTR
jgi:hypothetical protein